MQNRQALKKFNANFLHNVDDLSASFRKMAILGNRQKKEDPVQQVIPMPPAPQEEKTTASNQPNAVLIAFAKFHNNQIEKPVGKTNDTGQLSIFDLLAS